MKNSLSILGKKWVKQILILLSKYEEVNFSKIITSLNITTKVLSERLNLLRSYGLIKRHLKENRSTHYSLTEKGKEIVELIKKMDQILEEKEQKNKNH